MGSTEVKFYQDDLVRVRRKPHLVGTVSSTHGHFEDGEDLEDLFILSHTSVPKDVFLEFMETGTPPRSYIFVEFPRPCHGYSLIHEDDLELLDRSIDIGTPVKKHLQSPFSGTVVSKSVKCGLLPIAYQPVNPRTGDYGPLRFSEKPNGRIVWPSAADSSDDGPPELNEVPMAELAHHEPFREGDLIIYRQKVGRIGSVERDAALLLSNQKVTSIHDYKRIETPILNDEQDLVAMPEPLDWIHTYPLPDGRRVWSSEAELVVPGQYAITSATNVNRNDLRSDTGPDVLPEGYILTTTATDYHIDWVCPNVFAVGVPYRSPNSERLGAATVHEHAVKCDFGQLPKEALSDEKTVSADMWLSLGDLVRFRDPTEATRRYPQYRLIPTDESFGHDLNVLEIVSTKTKITVEWQDGSITTEDPACLHMFNEFLEDELWPGNVVVLKEAIEAFRQPAFQIMHPSPDRELEIMECYKLNKVGVVQTVDGGERIASVRWYENPHVELGHSGRMMIPTSYLGALGSVVTDVSFYELAIFSCLNLFLDSMVLFVPSTVHQETLPRLSFDLNLKSVGLCRMSSLMPKTFFQISMYLEALKIGITFTEWFKNSTSIDTSPVPSRFSLHHVDFNVKTPADFFGRVISIDTNGIITVRLSAANNCHDVRVSLERLLLVIDGDALLPQVFPSSGPNNSHWTNGTQESMYTMIYGTPWDCDGPEMSPPDQAATEHHSLAGSDTEMDLGAENPEYSDEDGTGSGNVNDGEIHELNDEHFEAPVVADIIPPEEPEDLMDLCEMSPAPEDPIALSPSLAECPPAFALLEGPPPSDHPFLASEQNDYSGPLIRRIHREYEILRSSLPPGIVVRTWESRIDLFRVLILGPQGTPYEYAPFVIDFHFSNQFPESPPTGFFHSWTNNAGRINPNLYEDGMVCLSILGTWTAAKPEEGWSAANSTVLQILVSIMGLVLVKAPFYNEAGYEVFAEGGDKQLESAQYTERAFLMTRKFIQHALEHPVAGLEDVLAWHYLPAASNSREGDSVRPRLLRQAIDKALEMIEHHECTTAGDELDETKVASPFMTRLSLGAVVMLRKHVTALEHIESTKRG